MSVCVFSHWRSPSQTLLHLATSPRLCSVVCFDAKINFDDNAEFRQKAVFAMDDMTESDPTEMEAAKWDLKYIGLDGNIACFGMEMEPARSAHKHFAASPPPPNVSHKSLK